MPKITTLRNLGNEILEWVDVYYEDADYSNIRVTGYNTINTPMINVHKIYLEDIVNIVGKLFPNRQKLFRKIDREYL